MTATKNGEFVRTPLIAGNWKMNLDHQQAIAVLQKLAWGLQDAKFDFERVEVAVFPPFTDIRSVQSVVEGDSLQVRYGAQDLSDQDSGAYTGDISGEFLQKLGCTYVLVGHSERRSIHEESNEQCLAKIKAALRHGLTAVLCVGEGLEVREAGDHVSFSVEQMLGSLQGLSAADLKSVVIAYEPVWAIGTGKVAGPEDAQEMAQALRQALADTYDQDTAQAMRILYGGSVKSKNVASILGGRDVDGALVGGASLDPEEFASIAKFEQHLVTD